MLRWGPNSLQNDCSFGNASVSFRARKTIFVPTSHFIMGLEGEEVLLQNAIGEPGSGGSLFGTLHELGVCLDVHVLQRVASVEPIVSQ